MRGVKTRRLLALLAVVPVLVACSGGDDPEPQASTAASAETGDSGDDETDDETEGATEDVDACSLFSTDEVSEAVGADVKEGVGSSGPVITGGTQATCTWQGAEGASQAFITIYTDASAADSVKTADSLPLPEVGNDAFIGPVASVWAYVGDGSFTTQWYELGALDDENLPKSIALAQLYLEKV